MRKTLFTPLVKRVREGRESQTNNNLINKLT